MTLISNTLYLWSLSPSLPSSPTHRLCFVCTTPLKSCCLSRSFSPTESAPVTCKGSCCSIHKYIVNHPHFPTVPKAFPDPPPPPSSSLAPTAYPTTTTSTTTTATPLTFYSPACPQQQQQLLKKYTHAPTQNNLRTARALSVLSSRSLQP